MVVFCLAVSIIFLRFIHIVIYIYIYIYINYLFLMLNSILLHGYTSVLSIHQLKDM